MKNKGNATVWFAVGFVVVVTVVVIVAAVVSSGSLDGTPSSDTPAPAVTEGEWMRGSKDAKVTLIEYSDFQCPACASYESLIRSALEAYGDDLVFVYRHFPLYTIHPNAGPSAQAAEAAGLQGKFWEMHDILFEKQQEWASTASNRVLEDNFVGYAREIGLDVEKFRKDVNSDQVLNKIKSDADGANAIGVGRTPTFYVNLKQIPNPRSLEELKSIIDDALASS